MSALLFCEAVMYARKSERWKQKNQESDFIVV